MLTAQDKRYALPENSVHVTELLILVSEGTQVQDVAGQIIFPSIKIHHKLDENPESPATMHRPDRPLPTASR